MINYVKFKGVSGTLYLNPELIQGCGVTGPSEGSRVSDPGSFIKISEDQYRVKDTPTEIERKLKKFYERKRRIEGRFTWCESCPNPTSESLLDILEMPEESQPDPRYEKENPATTEQNTSAERPGTIYTTDPNTPLRSGDKWEWTGKYLMYPMWVQDQICQAQGGQLFRSVPDTGHPGPSEAPSL
jgi:hypothetical protein